MVLEHLNNPNEIRMRWITVTIMLVLGAFLQGCSSYFGPQAMHPQGDFSYEGAHIAPTGSFGPIQIASRNEIKVDWGRVSSISHDRVRVAVNEAIADYVTGENSFGREQQDAIASAATEATRESVLRSGRFELVSANSQGDIIVTPYIRGISAWGDWLSSKSELSTKYGETGRKLDNITREGVDMLLVLRFAWPNGNEFAAYTVTNRKVSIRGTIIDRASLDHVSSSSRVEQNNAKISEDQLPFMITNGFDAAVIGALEKVLDAQLWDHQPDAVTGRRPLAQAIVDNRRRWNGQEPLARPEDEFQVQEAGHRQ